MTGIYQIQSIVKPDRIYIGSSVDIKRRFRRHKEELRNKIHRSIKLQRHYNKYGESDLIFSILLGCEKEDLIKHEQFFIDSINPWFNICKIAGSSLGYKHSEESKRKISLANKGTNTTPHTEDHKKKNSEAIIKLWQNPIYREKISKARKIQFMK